MSLHVTEGTALVFQKIIVGWDLRQLLASLAGDEVYLEEVCNNAVVRHLEDWSLRVLVDSRDHLTILHAGQVLNGARDTNGYVQVLQAIKLTLLGIAFTNVTVNVLFMTFCVQAVLGQLSLTTVALRFPKSHQPVIAL